MLRTEYNYAFALTVISLVRSRTHFGRNSSQNVLQIIMEVVILSWTHTEIYGSIRMVPKVMI